jgi:hypothetical protein
VILRPGPDRKSPYAALGGWRTTEGDSIARKEYDYVNASRAFANKLISSEMLDQLMRQKAARLLRCGFEDLNPKPDHLLISFEPSEKIVLGSPGQTRGAPLQFRARPAPPKKYPKPPVVIGPKHRTSNFFLLPSTFSLPPQWVLFSNAVF